MQWADCTVLKSARQHNTQKRKSTNGGALLRKRSLIKQWLGNYVFMFGCSLCLCLAVFGNFREAFFGGTGKMVQAKFPNTAKHTNTILPMCLIKPRAEHNLSVPMLFFCIFWAFRPQGPLGTLKFGILYPELGPPWSPKLEKNAKHQQKNARGCRAAKLR